MPSQSPTIYLIAGCNGAGKTTFAKEFLPKEVKCLRFLNADEIARGLSPLRPELAAVKAARRGLITISHCGPISGKRTRRISRNRLFTRLRFTAFPNARGTVNPSLGPWRPSLGTCRQNAAKYGFVIRLPLLYAVRKSEVRRIRALFGKPKLVGVPDGSLVTHREFMAALGAAPRDYCPSIFGAHAYQEPVRLRPFTVIGLKCAFWHFESSTRARHPKLRS